MNGNTQQDILVEKRITSAASTKNKTHSYENLLINKYLDDLQQTEYKRHLEHVT